MLKLILFIIWCILVFPVLVTESSITIAMFILFSICSTGTVFYIMLYENLELHKRISELDSRIDSLVLQLVGKEDL